jgi:hypothetical protein
VSTLTIVRLRLTAPRDPTDFANAVTGRTTGLSIDAYGLSDDNAYCGVIGLRREIETDCDELGFRQPKKTFIRCHRSSRFALVWNSVYSRNDVD